MESFTDNEIHIGPAFSNIIWYTHTKRHLVTFVNGFIINWSVYSNKVKVVAG